ncbi:hypothetical protein BMR1_02g01945 [Babesia microti strain RI]|uniref:Uncharacterized protein n=1 Tax=Babesia microti (strain RI) TaxID=1133968 RepID=I7J677_BABMR|nr:hypothetical protein BMR1_02g01945 [Babesia microti strain RI]CCF73547.1 hypothetical protein BMR1_02g01945 [Babesia microti strain RI]|eukprot:XP_012648156.1 hypothetical protein BMR1_02g01945 [Babesia microti strain RI]
MTSILEHGHSSRPFHGKNKVSGGGSVQQRQKPSRPLRPEVVSYHKKIQEEENTIVKLLGQLSEINKVLNSRRGDKEGYTAARNEIRSNMDSIQEKIAKLEAERSAHLSSMEMKQKEMRDMKQNVIALKKSIGCVSQEELDRQIAVIESQMMTSSLSLKEEKAMMAKIAQLQSTKPLLESCSKMETSANNDGGSGINSIKSKLDGIRDEILMLRREKREENSKLFSLVEDNKKSMDKFKHLFEKRDSLSTKIKEHLAAKKKLIKELDELNASHYAKQQELYKQRMAKQMEEKAKKVLENEKFSLIKQIEQAEVFRYEGKVRLIEQLLAFINKQQQQTAAEKAQSIDDSADKSDAATTEPATIDGMVMLPRKEKSSSLTNVNSNNASSGGKKKGKKEKGKITIDMSIIGFFDACGVPAPVTAEDFETCKAKLKEKLDGYEKLRSEANFEKNKAELEAKLEIVEKRIANKEWLTNAKVILDKKNSQKSVSQVNAKPEDSGLEEVAVNGEVIDPVVDGDTETIDVPKEENSVALLVASDTATAIAE